MVFDLLVGSYIYFVLTYIISWIVVHRTKFDCLCEMTEPLRRLLVTSAGPFFPLGIIVAVAVALPFALPYGILYLLFGWVPPFTFLRKGAEWAMRKQEEEIEQLFKDKTKKDYLEYMNAQTPKEIEETKEWLRGQGLYYVLDEEEPTFRIKISHEVPIILSELVEDAKELGGTDFTVDYSTNSAYFLGTPTILQKMRNTLHVRGFRGDEVRRVTGDRKMEEESDIRIVFHRGHPVLSVFSACAPLSDGELPAEFSEHLAACESCQKAFVTARLIKDRRPPWEPSEDSA